MIRSIVFTAAFLGAVVVPGSSVPVPSSHALDELYAAIPRLLMWGQPSRQTPAQSSFRTEPVERGDLVATVRATGTLNALVEVEVGSQLSGRVQELHADFNSKVAQGEVIARVEPESYEARVAQADAELEMAQAQVSVQRAQIERSRAELAATQARHEAAVAQSTRAEIEVADSREQMERKRSLAKSNVISAGDWERIQTAFRSAEAHAASLLAEQESHFAAIGAARAAISMAEAQLTNTLAQVKQKEAILRQAQIDLDRTYIRAPVTGTVVYRAVSGGQTLAANLQTPVLFTIAQDLTQMQVEASVVEADISRYEVGQPVRFTVDAFPDRIFAGSVKQIRKAPQMVQNVVTYVVVIAAENSEELLLPGMTANLEVEVARRNGILKVPNTALRFQPPESVPTHERDLKLASMGDIEDEQEEGKQGQAFVLEPSGRLIAVPLRLGLTDGRMTEILAGGLEEGDRLVTGLLALPGREGEPSSVLVRFRLW